MDIREHLTEVPACSKKSLIELYKSRASFIDSTKDIFVNSLVVINERVIDVLKFEDTEDETMVFYIYYLNDYIPIDKPLYKLFESAETVAVKAKSEYDFIMGFDFKIQNSPFWTKFQYKIFCRFSEENSIAFEIFYDDGRVGSCDNENDVVKIITRDLPDRIKKVL